VKHGKRSLILGLFAGLECATGIGLFLAPGVVIGLLFGQFQPAPESLLLARLGGAALLTIGVASWGARTFDKSPASFGLLIGITLYNGLATVVLAYGALGLNMRGILIWPAVLIHTALLVWCLATVLRVLRRH
jgi:hypothetical protein